MKILIILIMYTLNGQTGDITEMKQVGGPYKTIQECSEAAQAYPAQHLSNSSTVNVYSCAVRPVSGKGGEDL